MNLNRSISILYSIKCMNYCVVLTSFSPLRRLQHLLETRARMHMCLMHMWLHTVAKVTKMIRHNEMTLKEKQAMFAEIKNGMILKNNGVRVPASTEGVSRSYHHELIRKYFTPVPIFTSLIDI